MGVMKEVFYSVECDNCGCTIENYDDSISRFFSRRTLAINAAKHYGFKQEGTKWLCPECANNER